MAATSTIRYGCVYEGSDWVDVVTYDDYDIDDGALTIECHEAKGTTMVGLNKADALALADQIYAAFAGPLTAQLRKIGIKQEEPT